MGRATMWAIRVVSTMTFVLAAPDVALPAPPPPPPDYKVPDCEPGLRKVHEVEQRIADAGLDYRTVTIVDRVKAKNSTVKSQVPEKMTQLTLGEIMHLVVDPLGDGDADGAAPCPSWHGWMLWLLGILVVFLGYLLVRRR